MKSKQKVFLSVDIETAGPIQVRLWQNCRLRSAYSSSHENTLTPIFLVFS
jgi:hypothetical protein